MGRWRQGLEVEIRSILSVVSDFLSPTLHTPAIVLLACVVGGELRAADDREAAVWFPLCGPLPETAFEADAHICERHDNATGRGACRSQLCRCRYGYHQNESEDSGPLNSLFGG